MSDMHAFFDDVVSTHELIRGWLAGATTDAAVYTALLARFAPGFSMISPGGKVLDKAGLAAFFNTAAGSRPGLEMQIADLLLLQESEHGATVSYRERQTQTGAQPTERWSTVVYEKTPDGRLLWRHLHETWAAPQA